MGTACTLLLQGCFGESDEERYKKVKAICDTTTMIKGLELYFTNYDSAKLAEVIVAERISSDSAVIIDTVHAVYHKATGYRKGNSVTYKEGSWKMNRPVYLAKEYLFYIQGDSVHLLRKMKYLPAPRCNMFDCNYEACLGEYELDGKVEQNVNGWGIRFYGRGW